MRKRRMFPGDRLMVRLLRRRYLRAVRANGGRLESGELASDATARLSIDGIHRLRETLAAERERMREHGQNRMADGLTSAIRELESRAQILDDLLR